ncbi:hypothetical protein ADK86_05990 [Streptomyces sp. NRRL F-5755]|nr:hypothetical protein ADK86_05990 [Streptomyces sp. NRRL F-5755]
MITGAYRASWHADVQDAGPVVVAEVGTSAAQARRLESGFVGADSLGRHYAQPPFPTWARLSTRQGLLWCGS